MRVYVHQVSHGMSMNTNNLTSKWERYNCFVQQQQHPPVANLILCMCSDGTTLDGYNQVK